MLWRELFKLLAVSDSFRTILTPFRTQKSSEMKTKAKSFPLTVKAGSTTVKVYRDSKASGDYFRVVIALAANATG